MIKKKNEYSIDYSVYFIIYYVILLIIYDFINYKIIFNYNEIVCIVVTILVN